MAINITKNTDIIARSPPVTYKNVYYFLFETYTEYLTKFVPRNRIIL